MSTATERVRTALRLLDQPGHVEFQLVFRPAKTGDVIVGPDTGVYGLKITRPDEDAQAILSLEDMDTLATTCEQHVVMTENVLYQRLIQCRDELAEALAEATRVRDALKATEDAIAEMVDILKCMTDENSQLRVELAKLKTTPSRKEPHA